MPKEESRKKFINPLTQPSTVPPTETETNMPTLPTTESSTMPQTAASTFPDTSPSTAPDTQAETYTSAEEEWEYRKTGKEAFEKTHKRVTWWLPKTLEKRFNAFARKSSQRKVALVKEAITDLLEKHEKPKEPSPWPQYLAEKEQEVLVLRKLVRRYYTLVDGQGLDIPEHVEWHAVQQWAKSMLGEQEEKPDGL